MQLIPYNAPSRAPRLATKAEAMGATKPEATGEEFAKMVHRDDPSKHFDSKENQPFGEEDSKLKLEADPLLGGEILAYFNIQAATPPMPDLEAPHFLPEPLVQFDPVNPRLPLSEAHNAMSDHKLAGLSPAIALLSGRVELIPPKDMAKTIFGSPFIEKSMEYNDLNEFFSSPQPLKQLVSSLEMPATLVAMNEMSGERLMSPEAFLNELGLDVQNLRTELSILKETLPIEGVTPYMLRSAVRRAGGFETMEESPAKEAAPMIPLAEPLPISGQPMLTSNPEAAKDAYPLPTMQTQRPAALESEIDLMARIEGNWQAGSKELFRLPDDLKTDVPSTPLPQDKTPLMDSLVKSSITTAQPSITSELETDGGEPAMEDAGSPPDLIEVNDESTSLLSRNGSSFEDKSSSQDQDEPAPREDRPQPSLSEGLKAPERFTINPAEAKTESATPATEIRHAIMEKAQMLISKGGGSISVEVGTPELGQVEMAIHVQDKNLELKITAATDKAREMLSQELPALRQALLNQSLDLKTVEIGLSAQRQWSQSFQDPQGRGQQQFYEEFTQEVSATRPLNLDDVKKRSSQLLRPINPYNGSQIQLRV